MRYFFLALSVIILWSSCSKNPTINNSRESMLRKGKWRISGGTLSVRKPNGVDTILNYTNWIPYCHKDDYIVFDSGNRAYLFPGSVLCNPSDADSTQFVWKLENGENNISLYNGFNNTFAITETVLLPFFFDTVSTNPILVLDTIINAATAAAMTPPGVIVLDSMWKLHFDTTAVSGFDIYHASISYFSQNTFTINYALYSTYPDSTGHHTGFDAANGGIDFNPIISPDTFHYSVTFTNF